MIIPGLFIEKQLQSVVKLLQYIIHIIKLLVCCHFGT